MRPGTVHNRRLTLLAWLGSITVHVVVLIVFAGVRFADSPGPIRPGTAPAAAAAHIRRQMELSPITPKPKTREWFSPYRAVGVRPPERRTDMGKLKLPNPEQEPGLAGVDVAARGDGAPASQGIQFFGQFTQYRKICYVVDASGSMHGRLGQVKRQLTLSIAELKPDQYFYVIFFLDGDRLLETGAGRMVRATPQAKSSAQALIDTVRPSGPTNAVQALRRAMEIRDSLGRSPELVYFLTDGFDLGQEAGTEAFAAEIEAVRKTLAPATRINTIGFGTEAGDARILQSLARHSAGQFTSVP